MAMLLGCAALIALPLSALGIARYLAFFTERAPSVYLSPLAALLSAVVVIAAAATREGWLATRLRPATALYS